MNFTPCQKIKREILLRAYQVMNLLHFSIKDENEKLIRFEDITPKNIDYVYSDLNELDEDFVREEEDIFRTTGIETDIPPEWSRHYSSKSVAKQLSDGTWVGFTCFFGGGKHGCPEEMNWMEDAYYLEVTKTERLTTIMEFKKINS